MKTSQAGIEFIARHEGWVNHVYKDVAGIDTIGYGHVIKPGENFPPIITKEKGLQLLGLDLFIAEFAVGSAVKVPINQDQFDAMVSFTFNMGGNAFATSTLLRKLNEGDVAGAADEFLRWNKARIDGELKAHLGLTRRRQEERAVFLKPQPVVVKPDPVIEPPVVYEPVPPPRPEPPVAPPSPPIVVRGPSALTSLINFIVALFSAFFGKKN